MILVSACLIGINCRYDGKTSANEELIKLVKEGKAISVCPEVLGGLSIPRVPCEIINNDGELKVINKNGVDCTEEFKLGAEKSLEIAKKYNIKKAILKSKSPSCGSEKIYDGSFKGNLIDGEGITVKLLRKNGIEVINEKNFKF